MCKAEEKEKNNTLFVSIGEVLIFIEFFFFLIYFKSC